MDLSKQGLVDCWNIGWQTVATAIKALKEEDLEKEITIRLEKLFV